MNIRLTKTKSECRDIMWKALNSGLQCVSDLALAMILIAFFCNLNTICARGSEPQMMRPYCIMEWKRPLYMVTTTSVDANCLTFLRRNSVWESLWQIYSVWVLHLRSLSIWRPRHFTDVTLSGVLFDCLYLKIQFCVLFWFSSILLLLNHTEAFLRASSERDCSVFKLLALVRRVVSSAYRNVLILEFLVRKCGRSFI